MSLTARCNSPTNRLSSQWSSRNPSKPNNLPIIRLQLSLPLSIRNSKKPPLIPGLIMAFQAITCIVISIITVVQTYHHLDRVQLRIIPKMKTSISLQAWHRRSTTTSWMTTISSTSHLLTAQSLRMISSRGKRKRRLQIWIIHICSVATNQQPLAPWIIYRCLNNSSIYPANIARPPLINRITSKRNTTGRIRQSNTNSKIATHNNTPPRPLIVPSITRCQLWTTSKGILC